MEHPRPFIIAVVAATCAIGIAVVAGVRYGAIAVLHDAAPTVPTVAMEPCDPTINLTNLDLTGVDRYFVPTDEAIDGIWTATATWSNGTTTTATAPLADGKLEFTHPTPYMTAGVPAVVDEITVAKPDGTVATDLKGYDQLPPGDLVSCLAEADVESTLDQLDAQGVSPIGAEPDPAFVDACGVTSAVSNLRLDHGIACLFRPLTAEEEEASGRAGIHPDVFTGYGQGPTDRFVTVDYKRVRPPPPNLIPWRLALVGALLVSIVALWAWRRPRGFRERR